MVTALFRTIILYFVIMIGLRLMGKRQIGELEPSELVLTMMVSDLAAVPMQDLGIPLINGVIPILTLLSLSMLLSLLSLKNLRFRRLVCGEPTVLIRDGRLDQQGMEKNRFTVDELMEELRAQGISDPATVKYAVLENSGQLSILPYAHEQPITPKQMGRVVEDDVTLPTILINDGRLVERNLHKCNKTAGWLQKQLTDRHLRRPADVFLMTLDENDKILCIPKEGAAT